MVRGVTLHTAVRQARRAGRRSAHFQTGVSSCETGLTSDLTVVCKLAYCQAGGGVSGWNTIVRQSVQFRCVHRSRPWTCWHLGTVIPLQRRV